MNTEKNKDTKDHFKSLWDSANIIFAYGKKGGSDRKEYFDSFKQFLSTIIKDICFYHQLFCLFFVMI